MHCYAHQHVLSDRITIRLSIALFCRGIDYAQYTFVSPLLGVLVGTIDLLRWFYAPFCLRQGQSSSYNELFVVEANPINAIQLQLSPLFGTSQYLQPERGRFDELTAGIDLVVQCWRGPARASKTTFLLQMDASAHLI